MTDSFYWLLLLMVDGVIMFMGLNLIFGFIPNQLKGTTYHKARIYMGLSFVVSPATAFLFYCLNLQNADDPSIATAVNLSDYYAIAILMMFSFLTILGHKRDRLRLIALLFTISYAIYLIPVWGPYLTGNGELILQGYIR